MSDLPLALALTAGMLAAVNPCGFALLPAYLGLLIADGEPPGRATAVGRALLLTLGMTLGFAAVFGVFGLALTPVADSVQRGLPYFTAIFGLLLAVLGGWLLAGRSLPSVPASLLPRPRRVSGLRRGLAPMALFGAAYALASLSCTVAPFLAIVVSSFRAGSSGAGLLLWSAYAAGMGLVVGTAALGVALARGSLVGRMRALGPVVSRAGGALLLVAGAYVAYYGWWEVRTAGSGAPDPVIEAAGRAQSRLADGLEGLGPGAVSLVLAAALAAVALVAALGRHRRRGRVSPRVPEASDAPTGRP